MAKPRKIKIIGQRSWTPIAKYATYFSIGLYGDFDHDVYSHFP